MSCTIPAETIDKTIAFHGHSCPGLAIGIRAAELAIREIGDPEQIDMVAISETDMCGVDAIQFLTGCTYGKGNFIHRDYGKMAFSFYDRDTGKGIRALLKPEPLNESYMETRALMIKDLQGTATDKELERMEELRTIQQKRFMALKLKDMFDITELGKGLPRSEYILESLVCEACGENVMESRTRRLGGQTLCIPCFNEREQKV